VDDLDGTVAVETVRFVIGGKSYEIDLSAKNVAKLDALLEPYKARRSAGRVATRRTRGVSPAAVRRSAVRTSKTLFSELDPEEKAAFRLWAKLPNTRRISDERVQGWIDAGKPAGRKSARKAPPRKG
jgi:hypothetical protein